MGQEVCLVEQVVRTEVVRKTDEKAPTALNEDIQLVVELPLKAFKIMADFEEVLAVLVKHVRREQEATCARDDLAARPLLYRIFIKLFKAENFGQIESNIVDIFFERESGMTTEMPLRSAQMTTSG